jgi:hypothetical protein
MKQLYDALAEISEFDAWGARVGHGTHVLIDFGPSTSVGPREQLRGEFGIWIPGSPWRLMKEGIILAGSGQDVFASDTLGQLNGDRIKTFRILPDSFDVVLEWASGSLLYVFNEYCSDDHLVVFYKQQCFSISSTGGIMIEFNEKKHQATQSIT